MSIILFVFLLWFNIALQAQPFMVATANPYATQAGYKVLQKGGNAIDAAVAIQMVLALVEPQSSGIGGGAFLLYWDNTKKELTTFDGRETAPQAATETLFLDKDGKPLDWWEALAGGRSVGVPGVIALLEKVHKRYGKLTWASLFEEAITLSKKGFIVSEQLHLAVKNKANPALGRYDAAWSYFYPQGKPIQKGSLLTNKPLAETLSRIAHLGASAFYKGDIALDIVATVQNAKDNPGLLTIADMMHYKAKERPPVCAPYKSYTICGMGPPTSGGMTVIQILSLLKHTNITDYPFFSKESIHLFTQASRLAYADRNLYMADNDFVKVPVNGLINQEYLKERAKLIKVEKDMGEAQAGEIDDKFIKANSPEQPSTTHFSIIDSYGNAISMTSTVEMAFGSTLMVRGFLLNNQLTDFSFIPEKNNEKVANRVQGSKRPRSSMSPMMIFNQDNELIMIIGSPGGSRIISYVAKTIIAVLDWKLDIQTAIDSPHFINRNNITELEANTSLVGFQKDLEEMGHQIEITPLYSGLHGIVIKENTLKGGADHRREGMVKGGF